MSLNKPENLPEISDRALYNLKAGEDLKARILRAAVEEEKASSVHGRTRLVPVLLASVAVMILCVFWLNGKEALLPQDEQQSPIHSFSAGDSDLSFVSYQTFSEANLSDVKSVELTSTGKVEGQERIDELLDALKNHSDNDQNDAVVLNSRLNICGPDGLLFSLPAEAPWIRWADGIRRCDLFFELFTKTAD